MRVEDLLDRNGQASAEKILSWLISYDTRSSFESGKSKETITILREIGQLFEKMGVGNHLFEMNSPEELKNYNQQGGLCIILGNKEEKGGVLFSGHIDTVTFDEKHWTKDPLSLTREQERLYGRGTIDMKGQLAGAIAALIDLALSRRTINKPIVLAISSLEEIGCIGSKHLAERIRTVLGLEPDLIQILEPFDVAEEGISKSSVVVAHRGDFLLDIKVNGYPGHSSNPNNGVDAVKYGIEIWQALYRLQHRFINDPKLAKYCDLNFDPPYPIINPGIACTSPNAIANGIAGEFTLKVHCRVNPRTPEYITKPEETVSFITSRIKNSFIQLQTRMAAELEEKNLQPLPTQQFGIVCKTEYYDPPLSEVAKPSVFKLFESARKKTFGNRIISEPRYISASTDAGNYSRFFPETLTLVCGPGSLTQGAHGHDEYILSSQLEDAKSLVLNVANEISLKKNISPPSR